MKNQLKIHLYQIILFVLRMPPEIIIFLWIVVWSMVLRC
ncbi:hypothetical protein HNQ80_004849 [Anaerosolibacter carboniphilus]|uniref:Uncharacterized protein n=1 Tax=Anaerosolibacter carboniphilus TaxID=1417629 RepID=A0A841L8T6_9FIRM|nr:hypothetical protein [Anaerosolibacter carboniphilus]